MISKKPILYFVLGFIFSFFIFRFFIFKINGEVRDKKLTDAGVLAVRHFYGEAARGRAKVARFSIPEPAFDCYYSIGGGFQPVEFIAFSLPNGGIHDYISQITGSNKTRLYPAEKGLPSPEIFGLENKTLLYDISKISNPKQFKWILKNECPATGIIDEENSRIFVFIAPRS